MSATRRPAIRAAARASAALVGAAVALVGARADAIERQHQLGLAPALGVLDVKGEAGATLGVGGALHYVYGLNDQLNLLVEGSSVAVFTEQNPEEGAPRPLRPTTVDHAAVGVGYVIDILRWVPYVGVQGGVYRLAGGALDSSLFLPGLSAGVGLDYQLSRQWAVGLAGRQHFMVSKLDTYPSYTTVLLRVGYMWGY